MNRRKVLLTAVALLLVALMVGGTSAYFVQEETAHNVITTGSVTIDLSETDGNGSLFANIAGAMPGESYGKVVTVENSGDHPVYIRMKVDTKITLADDGQGDANLINLDFDTAHWELKDGYYYYKTVLEAGEATQPLFTNVTLDSGMDNTYQGCEVHVDVCAQAVQSANNGEDVLAARGWPAEGREADRNE